MMLPVYLLRMSDKHLSVILDGLGELPTKVAYETVTLIRQQQAAQDRAAAQPQPTQGTDGNQ